MSVHDRNSDQRLRLILVKFGTQLCGAKSLSTLFVGNPAFHNCVLYKYINNGYEQLIIEKKNQPHQTNPGIQLHEFNILVTFKRPIGRKWQVINEFYCISNIYKRSHSLKPFS